MPLQTFTIKEVLSPIISILQDRSVDIRLVSGDRTLCSDIVTNISIASGELRADSTIRPAVRITIANNLQNRWKSLSLLEERAGLTPAELYNAVDLLCDAEDAIRGGRSNFSTTL